MSYDVLRARGYVQWPCNAEHPDGAERLYAGPCVHTDPAQCEEYGHDLLTGAANEESDYRAMNPSGRAILKAVHYTPPHAAARAAERRLPAAVDHRPVGVPLPHQDQDCPQPRA
jgi:hypothetical protein